MKSPKRHAGIRSETVIDGDVGITFDIDWAPDWCIKLCSDICASQGVKATFFVTHTTSHVDELRKQRSLFEIGIHPNFLSGSTHGETPRQVLDYCLAIVPESTSMRTHSLVQSSRLFELIAEEYPNITTDVSLFLPLHQSLQVVPTYYGQLSRRIARIPFFWEDDVAFVWPDWQWDRSIGTEHVGIRIFNFHPIHVALNSENSARYEELKKRLGRVPLWEVTERQVKDLVNQGGGARSFLQSLVRALPPGRFNTVAEMSSRAMIQVDSPAAKADIARIRV